MTNEEWQMAGEILGTPYEEQVHVHICRSVHDCLHYNHSKRARSNELWSKSQLSMDRFEKVLPTDKLTFTKGNKSNTVHGTHEGWVPMKYKGCCLQWAIPM